ncbi:MAG: hypothetical protein U9Q68_08990 [Euryarchaeota archaeon]|nr:hypothetical protein [Euryarchaeota archaeon]
MEIKVKDLTVVKFQSLISDTMRATLKDLIEDVSALSSPEYLKSIEEVRNDYSEGRVKHLEEVYLIRDILPPVEMESEPA